MDVELAEVRDFLAAHPPFDTLPEKVLDGLAPRCTLRYARRGSLVPRAGLTNDRLFLVGSGAVDITDGPCPVTHGLGKALCPNATKEGLTRGGRG